MGCDVCMRSSEAELLATRGPRMHRAGYARGAPPAQSLAWYLGAGDHQGPPPTLTAAGCEMKCHCGIPANAASRVCMRWSIARIASQRFALPKLHCMILCGATQYNRCGVMMQCVVIHMRCGSKVRCLLLCHKVEGRS